MEAWKTSVSPLREGDALLGPHVLKALLEVVTIPNFSKVIEGNRDIPTFLKQSGMMNIFKVRSKFQFEAY